MATTLYSASLRLALPTTGDLFGTWGTEINNSITQMVDQAIAGRAVVSMTSDANYTLTALNGTSDEARCAVLRITSSVSLTATRNVVVPLVPKMWLVENATTGSQSIQIIAASGTGVTIPNGSTYWVRCDGTNVAVSFGFFPASLGAATAPTYTFVGDPDTGAYSPGANEWAVTTAGVQRVRVNGLGEVVVGGAAPVAGAGFSVTKDITGATTAYAARADATVRSGVTTAGIGYSTNIGTEAAVFTLANLRHFQVQQGTFGAGSTVTNQYGFHVQAAMTGGANNYAFRGALAAASTSWNLYMDGTAKNYLAGRTLVGTSTENTSGAKLQTSDGITFPATAVASSDANTLDDYEEGTFTPTVVGTSAAGVGTYSQQQGSYVKVGKSVHYALYLDWSAHTGTGDLSIAGLPFTAAAPGPYFNAVLFPRNIALTAGSVPLAQHPGSTATISLGQLPSGGGTAVGIPMDTSGALYVTGTYFV